MWEFRQSTGMLLHDSIYVAHGYSGRGPGKNNPLFQHVHGEGPIPEGRYRIGPPFDSQTHGPYVMGLAPDPSNDMHGRSGFLIHGDSKSQPGQASQGCIVLARTVRLEIWASGDRELEVVSGGVMSHSYA